ncbi:MAG: molybdopterin molybdotransferase MoeA [Spirochaetaceae bacterium]|jgi:molybdopterin molybdotransferase|nr:molybdopterin molybdotransferase MoeA [Spirochaetaceae bacterium]
MALTKIDDARKIIYENISETEKWEYVSIEDASMRILDEEILSPLNLPAFDRSKMDGWAIRSIDTPGKFKITGLLQAGAVKESFKPAQGFSSDHVISEGETYKIMTGAPVIKGADAVLQIEKCHVEGDFVYINETVKNGFNIAKKGEDISRGQLLLPKGTVLNAHKISLIAASGFRQVKVKKRLTVSILVTGNELLEPAFSSENPESIQIPEEGKIFNSNAWAFITLCKENNLLGEYKGSAGDRINDFLAKLLECLDSDIIIISGGVSVGDYDLVREGLNKFGADELFYKVSSKPGKPLLVSKKEKTLIFGFPGNPVSSMIGFREFLVPAIRRIYGQSEILPLLIPAVFSGSYSKNDDREHFINIKLFKNGQTLMAEEIYTNSSGDTVSFAKADALLRVSKNRINDGDIVEVELI